jgi:hypothetical protein
METGQDPQEQVHAMGLLRFLKVPERGKLRATVERDGLVAFRELNLYHTPEIDPRYKTPVGSQPESAYSALRKSGAGSICYAISHDPELYGRTDLRHALNHIRDHTDPNINVALLSCVPGELALWAGEYPDGWEILKRNPVS